MSPLFFLPVLEIFSDLPSSLVGIQKNEFPLHKGARTQWLLRSVS